MEDGFEVVKCHGFEPVEDSSARVLIVGTLPSVESLKHGRYYANPTNRFWRIIEDLIGTLPKEYDGRLQKLTRAGIALWDVCLSGERSGSLDSRIIMSTVVPNDFESFMSAHPSISLICFNGRTAEKIFRRNVATGIAGIRCELLPSSSAAHAITHEQKLLHWRNTLASVIAVN
jgi:double-stranded uracil-DNA glycosylase